MEAAKRYKQEQKDLLKYLSGGGDSGSAEEGAGARQPAALDPTASPDPPPPAAPPAAAPAPAAPSAEESPGSTAGEGEAGGGRIDLLPANLRELGDTPVEDLRPEARELLKQNRKRDVEIVSVDKGYKPKVSTWGVYPRPKNISKAYGGGRLIRPGDKLESDEAKQARIDRLQASMREYRLAKGLEISDEDREKVEALLKDGSKLMRAGRLAQAQVLLQDAVECSGFRGELGGEARLQLAICLDSQGKSQEAKELYVALGKHPNVRFAKEANRMLFGITTASEFMKADQFSYAIGDAYKEHFDKMGRFKYIAGEEEQLENERAGRTGALATAAVLLFPLGIVLALRAKYGMY